ncbi:MAG: hypothetical protein ABFC96_01780 [Thermoguttaceae bacterium]
MNQDVEHLRLLSIFHYVVAGIAALVALIPIFYLGLSLLMLTTENYEFHRHASPATIRLFALLYSVGNIVLILMFSGFAVCGFLAGRNLARRRRYTFCLVMAVLLCMFMPFGTVLGIFTLIVLLRPSVKTLFEQPVTPPT